MQQINWGYCKDPNDINKAIKRLKAFSLSETLL